ncbi:MAG: peptidylprolyl isomerase [Candidatus Omnitrophica bacterium]|nr:peptidylprolyl isomerase [Candidatus Omnitrophota bacterium]MBU1854004.1 peptidylprolyl isomerase [Candidatus Omnitrophota bacterium]
MRKINTYLYGVVILMLMLSCAISCSAAGSKYAAKVNGEGIKSVTLEAAIDNFIENQKLLGMTFEEGDKDRLRTDILEELISAELLYQESKKSGLGDLTKEVEEQLDNIKSGFESDKEFNDILKERGIAVKDLKEDIRKGVYIKEFLEKNIYTDVAVSEEEKKTSYEENKDRFNVPEQVKVSHILIRVEKSASPEEKDAANKKIEELRKRVVSGEDFAELAKENSEDASGPRGGDLGYFRRGVILKSLEDVAFGLEKDEISEVVETDFGYHIIKLADRKAPHTLSYSEVEANLGRMLLEQRRKETLDKFIAGLREKAKIERF